MPEVTIVSDEAFRLDASVAVNLLVSALRLLTHPDDLLTKAAIVKCYHIDVLKEQTEDNELLLRTNDLDLLLPEALLTQREMLLNWRSVCMLYSNWSDSTNRVPTCLLSMISLPVM